MKATPTTITSNSNDVSTASVSDAGDVKNDVNKPKGGVT